MPKAASPVWVVPAATGLSVVLLGVLLWQDYHGGQLHTLLVLLPAFLLALVSLLLVVNATRKAPPDNQAGKCNPERIQEKLDAILEASNEAAIMTDSNCGITLFSPSAESMFGYTTEEARRRPLELLLPNAFPDGPDCGIPSPSADNPSVREIMGVRKDGSFIPIRVSLSQVRLSNQQHYLALIQDLTEQRHNEQRLDYLERYDLLTGLLNRAEFERRLHALIPAKMSADNQYVVCHIDVDQFKVINDTCGHAAGDDMLRQLAILIRSQFREQTVIARTGGDEFGLLLPDCDDARAEAICRELMQTVDNFLFTWKDRSFEVGVSIGIAGFHPQTEDPSDALSRADVACHMAKHLGRGRLHLYRRKDLELIRHHGDMHLVSTIQQALNEGRFHLYAQPIAPISPACAGEQLHYEILVRMVDENQQLVIPENFIPAAERYILMPAIDRWVISSLFKLQGENLRRWAEKSDRKGFLYAINLSGTSMGDEGFLNFLKRQFQTHDIPCRSICFEITETAAIANLEKARAMIEELKALGCSFALDDFGSGLSSYAYLKLLPVDFLKIDGNFVRNMTEDPVDHAIVDSINQIGHVLGLRTIAEWAETPGTLIQLRALNVDYAQGYGVGDMISVEDFTP